MELFGDRTIVALRIAAVLALMAYVGVAGVAALASGPSWASRANDVCASWNDRADGLWGAGPKAPRALSGMATMMRQSRTLARGELRELQALPGRPAAATSALAAASGTISTLDAGLAAYRGGDRSRFLQAVADWQTAAPGDRLAALGAPACA